MEFITYNSTHEEIADGIRGVYGKKIDKDCSIVYLGNAIIAIGDLDKIKKSVECKTSEWISIGNNVYISIYEE
jgi:hypothetical protein